MRIVGGRLKGRTLFAPKGRVTRPTADRVREAMFNILAHADWAPPLEEARVIDVFAGSGAFGFEAISRGAAFALFVDNDVGARGAIRANAEAFDVLGIARVHRRDATTLGPKPAGLGAPFTLGFLDPPYGQGLVEPTLDRLAEGEWLARGAALAVEIGAEDPAPAATGFEPLDDRPYGAARVLFFRYEGETGEG